MNINADACREQPPHLHTTLSLTPPPVIYIYIELEAAEESEGREPRLITTGDNRATAPPLCRIITKRNRERKREREGWNPRTANAGIISIQVNMSVCSTCKYPLFNAGFCQSDVIGGNTQTKQFPIRPSTSHHADISASDRSRSNFITSFSCTNITQTQTKLEASADVIGCDSAALTQIFPYLYLFAHRYIGYCCKENLSLKKSYNSLELFKYSVYNGSCS